MTIKIHNHVTGQTKEYPSEDMKDLKLLGIKHGIDISRHPDITTLEDAANLIANAIGNHHLAVDHDFAHTIFEDPWDQHKHERGGDKELARANRRHKKGDEAVWAKHHNNAMKKSISSSPEKDRAIVEQIMNKFDQHGDSIHGEHTLQREYDPVQEPYRLSNRKLTIPLLFRSYKNSPHNETSTLLKFMIHRIENRDRYAHASPDRENEMDQEILDRMKQGKASQKNGGLSVSDLRAAVKNHPELMTGLMAHQRQLHNYLKTNYPLWVKNDKAALTRGLNAGSDELKTDHPLASYADIPDTGFGTVMHHRRVPLNNIWYSYMLGPESAASENFGPENEWVVSPHEHEKANRDEVHPAVPRHHFTLSPKEVNKESSYMWTPQKPEDVIEKINNPDYPDQAEKLVNHPSLQPENLSSLLEHKDPDVVLAAMKSPRANQTQVDNKILSLSGRNPSHGKILKNIADEMSVNKFTPKPHVFDHVVSQGPAFSRAIMNRNAPESAMEKVLNGGSVFGVDYVASHPNASNKLLRRIHDTTDSELVQAKVKDHPNFYKTSAEGENLEKAIKVGEVFVPDTEGEEHPEKKSLIEGKLSNGDMGWFLKPEIAKKKDDELWQLAAHNYGKFAPVKNLYSKMIGQVSKDPDRHAQVGDVRDAKGNKQIAVRSRHLLSALKGSEGCSLSHDGSKIYLTADRHSPNSPGVTSSWVFDENGFKNN